MAKRYLLKPERKIKNTEDVLKIVDDIRNMKQEHFNYTLTGDSNVIEKRIVFKGTINYSMYIPEKFLPML